MLVIAAGRRTHPSLTQIQYTYVYIYLCGGSDTEPTIEETIEHQSQQAGAEKAVCLPQ